ncbi:MAG: hypothetical protein NTX45_02140 [Proteobacteria bacterium]|nr:hypothetical protein [Pseudomonadota bacterium]
MTFLKVCLAVWSLVLLSGCATVFGQSHDAVTVNSNEPKAQLLADGVKIGIGTATTQVKRGDYAELSAQLPGCKEKSVRTRRRFYWLSLLNLTVWPGWIVDAVTGSMFRTDPTTYTVTPDCSQAVAAPVAG